MCWETPARQNEKRTAAGPLFFFHFTCSPVMVEKDIHLPPKPEFAFTHHWIEVSGCHACMLWKRAVSALNKATLLMEEGT